MSSDGGGIPYLHYVHTILIHGKEHHSLRMIDGRYQSKVDSSTTTAECSKANTLSSRDMGFKDWKSVFETLEGSSTSFQALVGAMTSIKTRVLALAADTSSHSEYRGETIEHKPCHDGNPRRIRTTNSAKDDISADSLARDSNHQCRRE